MSASSVLAAMTAALAERRAVALVTATGGAGEYAAQVGRHQVIWPDEAGAPAAPGDLEPGVLREQVLADVRTAIAGRAARAAVYQTDRGRLELFIDVQVPPPHLIIAGAGHIAAPLAAIAHICEFEVSVLDDRPQYASRERFPTATRVIAGPFAAELHRLRNGRPHFDAATYLVLVTRGHQHDIDCLLEVLDDPLAYIGMIGSRRRIRAVFELLAAEEGLAPSKFDRIHAPIGLDIAAQTPAEIAVAIMGEIIKVARGGRAASLSDELQQQRKRQVQK